MKDAKGLENENGEAMSARKIHPKAASGVVLVLLAMGMGQLARAADEAPVLALRVVDSEVQIGTDSTASYYIQWCTPMGAWSNWNAGAQIDSGIPSLWFRGVFEEADAEVSMQWDPPTDVSFYTSELPEPESGGLAWVSIGVLNAEGIIEGVAQPNLMSRSADPALVEDEVPRNNQTAATPDPGRVRLYWQNQTTRQPVIWHLGDTGVRKGGVTVASSPTSAWKIAGTGDIDGDGVEDLIWHNASTGRVIIWFLDPDGVYHRNQQVLDANLSTSWVIKGVEDMNQDGVPDLIWHQSTTGRTHIWALNAAGEFVSGWDVSDTYPATTWSIRGVADMNHDSYPDLIWHQSTTGRAQIWFLDDAGTYASATNVSTVNPATAWKIMGVADMNQDTNPDLIWHHATTGRVHIWFLDATGNYVSGSDVASVNLSTTWRIKGVVDVNADGNPDLVWHNYSTGRTHTWFLDDVGAYVSGTNATSVNLATTWQIDETSY